MDRSELLKKATLLAKRKDALLRQHRDDLKIYADNRQSLSEQCSGYLLRLRRRHLRIDLTTDAG